jgi:hypothetical protein
MRQPFCILSVMGDMLDDGELQFVAAARSLKAARRRVQAIGKSSPGQYVIYNNQAGECVSFSSPVQSNSYGLRLSRPARYSEGS